MGVSQSWQCSHTLNSHSEHSFGSEVHAAWGTAQQTLTGEGEGEGAGPVFK